jgi:hypothetical protein
VVSAGSLVDAVTLRALRLARRRWPEALRDEMSAEWAAELHAITCPDGTTPTTASRWQGVRFAVSLAWSRPPDSGLRSGWRPGACWLAVLAPLLAPLVSVLGLLGQLFTPRLAPPRGVTDLVASAPFAVLFGLPSMAVPLLLGVAAVHLPRLRGGVLPVRGGAAVCAMVLLSGLTIAVADGAGYSSTTGGVLLGVALWALAVGSTGRVLLAVLRRGRRRLAWLTAVVGGYLTTTVSLVPPVLAGLADQQLAAGPLLPYLPLWLPALATGQFLPVDNWFFVWDMFPTYPYEFLGATVFALGYVVGLQRVFADPLADPATD